MEHIGIVSLAVQAVQNGHEPASQLRKNNVCITSDLHKVPAQPGEVLHQDEVDNTSPGILQHLQKTGPLKVAPTVTVIHIGFDLYPAVEHSEFGQ